MLSFYRYILQIPLKLLILPMLAVTGWGFETIEIRGFILSFPYCSYSEKDKLRLSVAMKAALSTVQSRK